MKAAVFDLDGTLTDTSDVDAECYLQALYTTFGIDVQTSDWGVYEDVTDSGILTDTVRSVRGTAPTHAERDLFIRTFVSLLGTAHASDRSRFAEISGARSFVRQLQAKGWIITVATGGWRDSARQKLGYAGFENLRLPMASANDSRKRVNIVRTALTRAGVTPAHAETEIVVFGDALWDVEAAQVLGYPLVGIANGRHAEELRAAGAVGTAYDFSDPTPLLSLMSQATSGF